MLSLLIRQIGKKYFSIKIEYVFKNYKLIGSLSRYYSLVLIKLVKIIQSHYD